MNKLYRVLAVAGLAATLGACAPTSQTVKPASTGGAAGMGAGTGTTGEQGQANALQGQGGMSASEFSNPASPLFKRTIYFAFNSSAIAPQYLSIISAHAKYLSAHPATTIKLEGNTDDRGSHTYNMALGERRAQAVAKLLELQGVKPSQLDIISYGEDNPVCLQQNEACWQKNRRVDLVYPGLPVSGDSPMNATPTTSSASTGGSMSGGQSMMGNGSSPSSTTGQ
ncbi:peptidoglycan-associated lipoprotein Pal [Acidihalobacter prosperus]|uniref:Peptidoglycan-associated lipoprotein n=1 Tax=Acidihalobacter prosperus TaxID=160660 RepID=A0A1A6C6U7_9GAMM|nr:peptidoglycan-associated lipoprotein Pal [Acidihalobacter prosperus]OBS10282.1 peptidoglycan-associated lipoprotein [Acidihalobacter prosperus]